MQVAVPAGAQCGRHPELTAAAACDRCGLFLCADCAEQTPAGALCSECRARGEGRFESPWEDRLQTGQGVVSAWWVTCKALTFNPTSGFAGVGVGPVGPALSFAVVTEMVALAVYLPFQAALWALDPSLPANSGWLVLAVLVGVLVVSPVMVVIGFLVWAAFTLAFMRLVGGKGDYNGTLRAICYATAPMFLYIFPILGWAVGGGLSIVTIIYGQKHAHGISAGRVALAFLLPITIAVALLIAFAFVAGVALSR